MSILKYYLFLIMTFCLISCGDSFLDVKPKQNQRVPTSLEDYQAILDNSVNLINIGSSYSLGLIGADEYYVTEGQWQSFPTSATAGYQKRAYIWSLDVNANDRSPSWGAAYIRILRANVVLDGLTRIKISAQQQPAANTLKGHALFVRSQRLYEIAQLYCKVYDQSLAGRELGLPLRLEADVTKKTPQSTLAETYGQITRDLKEALELLPVHTLNLFRPSKAAALALLARVYLQMEDYSNAFQCADAYLKIKPELLDFNQLNLALPYTFPVYGEGNPEVIYMYTLDNLTITGTTYFNADISLLNSYEQKDLRLKAYFSTTSKGQKLFKGSYQGSNLYFTGLATDEVYLIRAECQARENQISKALSDLNYLLRHRYEKDNFIPLTASNREQCLSLVIAERRKELVLRGTRWEDLRRFNKDPRFARTLVRNIGDKVYELKPGDPRWVWPIPRDAVELGGYAQNE